MATKIIKKISTTNLGMRQLVKEIRLLRQEVYAWRNNEESFYDYENADELRDAYQRANDRLENHYNQ